MRLDLHELRERFLAVRVAAVPLSEDSDAQLLAAIVLVLAAVCDAQLSTTELRTIIGLLRARFRISDNEALKLLAAAVRELYEHEIALEDVRLVLERAGFVTDRGELLLMSLRVLAADGPRSGDELEFLSRLIDTLGLQDTDLDNVFRRYFAERTGASPPSQSAAGSGSG